MFFSTTSTFESFIYLFPNLKYICIITTILGDTPARLASRPAAPLAPVIPYGAKSHRESASARGQSRCYLYLGIVYLLQ